MVNIIQENLCGLFINYFIISRYSANKEINLKQWGHFGPLFFTIFLSYFLNVSKDTKQMSKTFIIVLA